MVAAILEKTIIPKMCRVRQTFDDAHIVDIEGEVKKQLTRPGTLDRIKPGQTIAVTAGSRGVANIARITRAVIDEIKRAGGKPFIFPAMGCHGGSVAPGQVEILKGYGITEEAMGCPIRATMETVQIGVSAYGIPVRIDKYASEADGIVVIGRVKSHTSFRGKIESGLLKMVTIGMGKQFGAEICHEQGFGVMERNVVSIAQVTIEKRPVLFGLATIENAFDETSRLAAVPAELFLAEEPALLEEAKANMPRLLIQEFDVLVIDEAGKNISGEGLDPNVTGTWSTPYASGGPLKQRMVLLDLTDESHGNAGGFGMVDFSTQRAFDKMDFEITYPNILTPTVIGPGKIPIIMANDELAIKGGIQTCNGIDKERPRVIRIKNTLKLGEILVSEALVEQARNTPGMEVLGEPAYMKFDEDGNLF
ncbi:MAG: nickel pincer cofactor-dependent isomerase, group 22 [Christensenellales bacterium]